MEYNYIGYPYVFPIFLSIKLCAIKLKSGHLALYCRLDKVEIDLGNLS